HDVVSLALFVDREAVKKFTGIERTKSQRLIRKWLETEFSSTGSERLALEALTEAADPDWTREFAGIGDLCLSEKTDFVAVPARERGDSGRILFLHSQTGETAEQWNGKQSGFVLGLLSSGKIRAVSSGSSRMEIASLDPKGGAPEVISLKHSQRILPTKWADRMVAVGDDEIALVQLPGGKDLWRVPSRGPRGRGCLALSEETNRMAYSNGFDRELQIIDLSDGSRKHRLKGHAAEVRYATFSGDGKFVASAATDGRIFVWRVEDGTRVAGFDSKSELSPLAFGGNGKHIWSTAGEHLICCYRIQDGTPLHCLRLPKGGDFIVTSLVLAPDGKRLVAGCHGFNGTPSRVVGWSVLP
ncbi:MAG: hypothetical protein AAF514_16645, partial [Verrucomicrobiota bacterium]